MCDNLQTKLFILNLIVLFFLVVYFWKFNSIADRNNIDKFYHFIVINFCDFVNNLIKLKSPSKFVCAWAFFKSNFCGCQLLSCFFAFKICVDFTII